MCVILIHRQHTLVDVCAYFVIANLAAIDLKQHIGTSVPVQDIWD